MAPGAGPVLQKAEHSWVDGAAVSGRVYSGCSSGRLTVPDQEEHGMADADRAMKTTRDDAQVFQLLAEAQRQYEQYLAITQNAAVFSPVESLVVPPSPDLPLSLTIWRDK